MGWLASLITAPIIGAIIKPLVDGVLAGYQSKLSADNTRDAQAVDLAKKEIEAEISARAAASETIKAEQGWWVTAIIRPLFAIPLALYWSKIIVWDKMLGWGTTDPLTGLVGEWAGLIILAYFVGRPLEKVAMVFGRRK
jgi:hypothetical protein